MKVGTFDIRAWTWRGRKLAHPLVIARRAAAFPIMLAGRALVFAGALIGWGLSDALDAWERTQ